MTHGVLDRIRKALPVLGLLAGGIVLVVAADPTAAADKAAPAKAAPPKKTAADKTAPGKAALPNRTAAVKPDADKYGKLRVLPPTPKDALLTNDPWKGVPKEKAAPADIDRLIDRELADHKIAPAALTTDDQFLRRVYIDLTGELPATEEVLRFRADKSPDKRSRCIDRLLETDSYATHWAHYWTTCLTDMSTGGNGSAVGPAREGLNRWFFKQFKSNRTWGEITTDLVAAGGKIELKPPTNPEMLAIYLDAVNNDAVGFLKSIEGIDAIEDRAATVSRIFLGIPINCARCHDHKFDRWRQAQFQGLTAFFARTPVREVGLLLRSLPDGEYLLHPERETKAIRVVATPGGGFRKAGVGTTLPKENILIQPRFLDGQTVDKVLPDLERRQALARFITAPSNYWFSAAYTNRIWAELLGQPFYPATDDLGPDRTPVMPDVIARLAASFQATNYDMKEFFRLVLNTKAYQRQSVLNGDGTPPMLAAAVYPSRFHAEPLVLTLERIFGIPDKDHWQWKKYQELFYYNMNSVRHDHVESTRNDILWLMNGSVAKGVHSYQRTPAKAEEGERKHLLTELLSQQKDDKAAIRHLYLRTLVRNPTDHELSTCLGHIRKTVQARGKRSDAYEDILWSVLNSTEFQRR